MAKRACFDLDAFMDLLAGLCQIHPFGEGNARTIAVFAIQYLNSLEFKINNEPFEKNVRYFRGALVRACCDNMERRVSPGFEHLKNFLRTFSTVKTILSILKI